MLQCCMNISVVLLFVFCSFCMTSSLFVSIRSISFLISFSFSLVFKTMLRLNERLNVRLKTFEIKLTKALLIVSRSIDFDELICSFLFFNRSAPPDRPGKFPIGILDWRKTFKSFSHSNRNELRCQSEKQRQCQFG